MPSVECIESLNCDQMQHLFDSLQDDPEFDAVFDEVDMTMCVRDILCDVAQVING